jgi:hypothetical protein
MYCNPTYFPKSLIPTATAFKKMIMGAIIETHLTSNYPQPLATTGFQKPLRSVKSREM